MGGLIFVGLGLNGLRDITLAGLDAIRSADLVMAEFYTSHMIGADVRDLEALAAKPVKVLRREDVELHGDQIIREAQTKLVAVLVAGDAMSATTHHDLKARAEESRVPTRYVPGVSIFTVAPAAAGLQIYKFGRTTTIPFPEGKYRPESFYDVIKENRARGLHTLVLLDIQADRNRYMTVREAVASLREVEAKRREGVVPDDRNIIGLARVGSDEQRVLVAPAAEWTTLDLGPPLHCLIVPGDLHFMEEASIQRMRETQSRSV